MKKSLALGLLFFFTNVNANTGDLLQGDKKLACEAILCLSSSQRPSECAESLNRYFSIKHKKPHKQIKNRRNFLKLCPEASADEQMISLTESLVESNGDCSAATLNRELTESRRFSVDNNDDREVSLTIEKYRIKNSVPRRCQSYLKHDYTDSGLHYVGSPEWQFIKDFTTEPAGKWVD